MSNSRHTPTLDANASAGVVVSAMFDVVSAQQSANGKADEKVFDAYMAASRALNDTAAAHLASDDVEVGDWLALADGPLTVARVSDLFGMLLSADGNTFSTEAWCTCGHDGESVRVERWSGTERTFHGYVCASCRHLTQTG